MTEFDKSAWAEAEFAKDYRDNAWIYVIERKRLIEVLKSFYRYFLKNNMQKNILDLGCGDGIITHEILKVDRSVSATLLDGSANMLNTAKERFKGLNNISYICASFQEVLEKNILEQNYNFIVSSLAIHHLAMGEKKTLFGKIYAHLSSGGYFVNIDVVLSPAETLERWYLELWKEWIDEKKKSMGIEGNYLADIARRYKDNKDNKPDTLGDQMKALKETGFRDVDCFYKYGIFSMYGGRK